MSTTSDAAVTIPITLTITFIKTLNNIPTEQADLLQAAYKQI